ncbi:MAG: cellulase family glycosylhydrolase [Chloroflexota bacterium]
MPQVQSPGEDKPPQETPADGDDIVRTQEAAWLHFETNDGAFVADAGGTNLTRLPLPPTQRHLRWSPDGQKIAFTLLEAVDVFNLYVMDADGTHIIRLTDHLAEDQYPAWSPDGRRIAFTSRVLSNYHLYVINRDGANLIELKPDVADSGSGNQAPVWSPDGQKIAFLSSQNQGMAVYIIEANGTNPVRLTGGASLNFGAAWSPDGRRLASSSSPVARPVEAQHLYVMNTDGTGQLNLTEKAGLTSAYAVMWSPQGQQILFSSGEMGAAGIYVIDADGANLTRLTDEALSAWYGVWSPDGRQIAFLAGPEVEEARLYVMNADGSNVIQLTDTPALISWIEWLPPAADPLRLVDNLKAETSEWEGPSAPAAVPTAQLSRPPGDLSEGGKGTRPGYGIQANPRGDTAANLNHLKTLGFEWVKFQMAWQDVEPISGEYEWDLWDEVIEAYANNDIKVLLSIPKAPDWARPADDDKTIEGPPTDPATYADFVARVAERYRGQVQAIEVWNEQNLWYEAGGRGRMDAASYVQLLQQAYQAVKAVNPELTVVSGAPTPAGTIEDLALDDVEYLEQMYAHGLKGYFDALGAHPAGYNCPAMADWQTVTPEQATATHFLEPFEHRSHSWCFLGTMAAYREVMVANGDTDKPIWPTEFGWAAAQNSAAGFEYARDNTAEEQTAWTLAAFAWAAEQAWVGPMFLWNLDYGVDGNYGELGYFSIIDQPVYEALAKGE